jgi:lysozyme
VSKLIEEIKLNEGFSSTPYPDPLLGWSKPTFGYGLTYITEDEAEAIVSNRIGSIELELSRRIPFYFKLHRGAKDALIEMAFQMGVNGTLNFKKMLSKLEAGDYEGAVKEALDSKWYSQTPNRAKKVTSKFLNWRE